MEDEKYREKRNKILPKFLFIDSYLIYFFIGQMAEKHIPKEALEVISVVLILSVISFEVVGLSC